MTMKAHTYYIIFERPPIGGKLPPSPWRRHYSEVHYRTSSYYDRSSIATLQVGMDCQARKLNKEDAMDRSRWRKLIKEGCLMNRMGVSG